MHIATVTLKSDSPYSQSRAHFTDKLDKESPDDYEKRTWRERCHVDAGGYVFVPPMAFKESVAEAAQYLSIKIPGKRNATWTKHFKAGILVLEGLTTGIKKADVVGEWLYLNADGKKGGTTRVRRCMPCIPEWKGDVKFHVFDDEITEDVFRHHIDQAGKFIGIGRFRPRNGGFYGRFSVVKLKWSEA